MKLSLGEEGFTGGGGKKVNNIMGLHQMFLQ